MGHLHVSLVVPPLLPRVVAALLGIGRGLLLGSYMGAPLWLLVDVIMVDESLVKATSGALDRRRWHPMCHVPLEGIVL